MQRIQAFEFNELSSCPKFIRDCLIEILGNAIRWGNIFGGVGPIFKEFCDKCGCETILDICSGSGEPASILIESLYKQDVPAPNFVISDLFPKIHAMEEVAKKHPGKIEIVRDPVDATDVPKMFDQPARTIINAFHHFPPKLGSQILYDCVSKKRGIFILEGFPRNFKCFSAMIPSLSAAMLLNPVLTKEDKLLKIIFTYYIPLIAILGVWDSTISVFRIYSKDEIIKMAKDVGPNYKWEYHEIPFLPWGRAVVFSGLP
ncbi:MAG: hypothetical protein HQK79_12255 [Desulfobacterales bacterium]|nr:hypothetical protein [Desulfobacterales bacterium]